MLLTVISAVACCQSAVSAVAQARSALLSSASCAFSLAFPGNHSLCLAFGSFILYLHPSLLFFYFLNQCDRCLVPLALRLIEVQIYQPWGYNSVQGLAVPIVEAPGHPRQPPPLSDALVKQPFCELPPFGCL